MDDTEDTRRDTATVMATAEVTRTEDIVKRLPLMTGHN